MIPRALLRHAGNLRLRVMVLMVAGVVFTGVGFELLLVTQTRRGLYEEMEFRTRSLAAQLADRAVTPLLLADTLTLSGEVHRRDLESDLEGIAVFDARGAITAESSENPGLWGALGPVRTDTRARHQLTVESRRIAGHRLLVVTAPVLRRVPAAGGLGREADALLDLSPGRTPGALRREHLGWLRVAVSMERIEGSIAAAARAGLGVLLAALLMGIAAISLLVRVVVRPLREASGLAREIAAGQLDRRLPVRSADELGALAESLNTMASALVDAREGVDAEARALRVATEATVEIARVARQARDPGLVFLVVAREVRRVTGCDIVALAETEGDGAVQAFTRLDPALPWGDLRRLPALDPDLAGPPGASSGAPRRIVLAGRGDALSRALGAEGFACAVLVPLALEGGPQAMLLLGSRRVTAFPSAEVDVVAALASHLSSALHAARLNDRLQDAFEELQRTHDYLVRSEMLRVAGEMASGVAHEFNNVLGAILGRAQLMSLRSVSGDLPQEELLESLAVIERAALDGRETGRRLRQFGKTSENAMLESVDLDRTLRDAVEFTRPRWENEAHAAGRHIEITVDSRPGVVVHGRGHEMREVFTNLILNAADALSHGGHIRLTAGLENGRVVTTVEDDGQGMSEETRRRLFEPFFTTKGPGGTGLGLSLVYGIVQRCDGTIDVESQPGQGTRIRVSFPETGTAPPAQAPPAAAGPAPAARTLDVLVVDDEDAVRDVLRDMVAMLGHRVVACASGRETLEAHAAGRFQLVLTDIGMPGINGWKLAHSIRAADPDVVIVFVTGWGEEVNSEAVRQAGVSLVISKPFSMEDILEATRITMEMEDIRRAA